MDTVVTVPRNFTWPGAPGKRGLAAWLAEGDVAGTPWSGTLWDYTTWGRKPTIRHGERVYVVCEGRLVGYAPLVRVDFTSPTVEGLTGYVTFVRGGGAVAVTLPGPIKGFRGWRYRFWSKEAEIPFLDWLDYAQEIPAPSEAPVPYITTPAWTGGTQLGAVVERGGQKHG